MPKLTLKTLNANLNLIFSKDTMMPVILSNPDHPPKSKNTSKSSMPYQRSSCTKNTNTPPNSKKALPSILRPPLYTFGNSVLLSLIGTSLYFSVSFIIFSKSQSAFSSLKRLSTLSSEYLIYFIQSGFGITCNVVSLIVLLINIIYVTPNTQYYHNGFLVTRH